MSKKPFKLQHVRSPFAVCSLQGRDNDSGFRGIGIKQTYVFIACRAGYRDGDGADFIQGWCKRDASMERGRYGLGMEMIRRCTEILQLLDESARKTHYRKNICFKTQNFLSLRLEKIVLWCNGSTTDSGSVCLGSNPGRTAILKGK